jgi:TolB-like protein/class 3 adenylate cyclase/tetratricopeptide (TPR) repeat protein
MENTIDIKTSPAERKLRAVMFADMVGYTAMMQQDEVRANLLRTRQKQILDRLIPAHNGNIIQYFGDGTLSLFDSSANAVRCAIAIQQELQKEPQVRLRIGIHSGDVVYDKEGIYGDCVNVASRIETLSVPGAVLFSEKVYDEIKNQKDIEAKSIGRFHLKNVQHPVEVFAASNKGMVIPLASEIHGKTETPNSFSSLFKKRSARLITILLFVLIGGVIVAGLFFFPRRTSGIDSIAVLPFANLSRDSTQQYFVDGMHETLISELSKIGALKVISRTSTIQYKDSKKSVKQIASELGVKALIEGSVIREGDKVLITVQLIDGISDKHIWSKDFNEEVRSILALYSNVARQIASKMEITLTPQDNVRLVSDHTVNPRAYERYLEGRHFWNQRTILSCKQAIESYKKALEFDSTYAPAYAAMADGYLLLGQQGGISQQESRILTEHSIQKALKLKPNLAEAYASLGEWKLNYEWNWGESEKASLRAIELNPGYERTYFWYGRNLGFAGRFNEALVQLEKAKQLDPLSPVIPAYIGQVYIFSKQYDKASEHLQNALELHPGHPLILHNIGELNLARGRYADAIDPLRRSTELAVSAHYMAMLCTAYARADSLAAANRILNELNTRSKEGLVSVFDLASVYLALGNKEEALSLLEKGFEQKDMWMKELKAWPWFDELKNEPRYRNLINKLNFPL